LRRFIANSLLLLCFGVLIAPISPAIVASNVPECCRRGGVHHCSAMASTVAGEAAFHSQNDCPMQRGGHAVASSAALPISPSASVVKKIQPLGFADLSRASSPSRNAGHGRAPPINS
jgi:hypothetical protein